jgi:hypothetical protein
MRWTGRRDHRTQPSVNGKALEQTSFVLGLCSETLLPFQIARPGAAQPEPAEAQTPIAISREKSEKPVTLDPEADWFLLPELHRSSLTS